MHPVSLFEALLSLVVGGFLGWLTGGLYNLLNGRRFSGHKKMASPKATASPNLPSVDRPKAKDKPEC